MYSQLSHTYGPQQDDRQTYNSEKVFHIENRGFLKMLFLLYDVTPAAGMPDFSPEIPTSPKISEYVQLESNGQIIGRQTTTYVLGRMGELSTTDYKKIEDGATLQDGTNEKQTCSLPLFFFAIDGQIINLNEYKKFVVRCRNKSDFIKMGFNKDVSIQIRIKAIYDRPDDYSMLLNGPKLTNYYNIEEFNPVLLSENQTHYRQLILNPHEISNIFLMIARDSVSYVEAPVNKVIVNFPSGKTEEFDNSTNYTISNIHSGVEDSVFRLNFSSRKKAENYLKTNMENKPLYLDIYFPPMPTPGFKLNTCVEYKSNIVENRVNDSVYLAETIPEGL